MVRTYKYAILQVMPDLRREERVNIGIVVFRESGLDIRVTETRKIRALAGGSWDSEIGVFTQALTRIDSPQGDTDTRLRASSVIQNQFSLQKTGWFRADSADAYDRAVRDILQTTVAKPKPRRQRDSSSIAGEISSDLRNAEILASKDDLLESGKVFRNYPVTQELDADFVQLNSAFHVATVLDLRAGRPHLAQAALKAVILDKAKTPVEGKAVHKIGVYAALPARRDELKDHLALLDDYADDVVNWDDPNDREGLKRIFYNAFNEHHSLLN
jgi:hypothetical protein